MTPVRSWHTPAPAVYLDQWVWIRFARVAQGNPREPTDVAAYEATLAAARRGVAFPLSATHYEETLRIHDPRQRRDLVGVMAPISQMCTLRRSSDLVRHQLRVAMHETIGRPAFRPTPPEVLGRGLSWAFQGVQSQLQVLGPDGTVQSVDPAWLRHATQVLEAQMLAGPTDDEMPELRAAGYISARELEERPGNRLAWEQLFAERLAQRSPPPSRNELRIWLLARELTHEYVDHLTRMLLEFRLTFAAIAGGPEGKRARRRAVQFAERVPTLRIAAEMKLEMFRNPSRQWTQNMIRDIDAISLALPYCRAVVIDRDAAALLGRSEALGRHGSLAVHDLRELPEVLDQIEGLGPMDPHPAGWDEIGPGTGYRLESPHTLKGANVPNGCRVRLCGPNGPLGDNLNDSTSAA